MEAALQAVVDGRLQLVLHVRVGNVRQNRIAEELAADLRISDAQIAEITQNLVRRALDQLKLQLFQPLAPNRTLLNLIAHPHLLL